jgi:hypothetical protein
MSLITKMSKDNWMKFINGIWTLVAYWRWLQHFREASDQFPRTLYFTLTVQAVRNELLMSVAHTVHLCDEIAKNHDIGSAAAASVKEIQTLYAKGDTPDRSTLIFDDCGVKPFRDKVLAHPLNDIKATLGKPEYQISLKWETVEETIAKINRFCDEVEAHNRADWDMSTYRGGDIGMDVGFSHLIRAFKALEKFENLKLEIGKKGNPRVHLDWNLDEVVIDD